MIAGLKPYPEYRSSNISWLEQIPHEWTEVSAKQHFNIQLGKMLQNGPRADEDVQVSYLKAQHVQWHGIKTSNLPQMWASPREVDHYGIKTGDLLVCEGGEGGRCFVLQGECQNTIIQNALHRVRPKNCNQNQYLAFVLSTIAAKGWLEAINNKATIAHFTRERFGSLQIPLPPTNDQRSIVRFLDWITDRLYWIIRKKRRVIALLNEQKQAIIHHAVTHGLDPKAHLKPSTIMWLGNIPAHWSELRSKYLFREVDKRSSYGMETHLSMSQKYGLIPASQIEEKRLVSETYVGAKLCEKGDLVLNRLKAHLGVFAMAKESGLVSPDYTVLRPIVTMDMRYFEAVYRTPACRVELRSRAKGIVEGFWRLYTDDFYDIRVPVPPIEEQHQIMDQLGVELSEVKNAILHLEHEIKLLNDYRSLLIDEVVTGKLDVRTVAKGLPDVAQSSGEVSIELSTEEPTSDQESDDEGA